ncbi:MAG: hypothetical protein JNM77_02535 [Pseudonocardia sp.]|nr:hypothetical protein [Pseudonocardia sp.]
MGPEHDVVVVGDVLPVVPCGGTAAAVTVGEAGVEFLGTRPAGTAG